MNSEEIFDIASNIAREYITKSTIHLFEYDGVIKPLGTGILLQFDEYYFLLTASHMAEYATDEKGLFFEFNKGEYMTIIGEVGTTDLKKDFKIDFACIMLIEPCIKNLKQVKTFLHPTHVAFGNISPHKETLLACGFPEYKNKEVKGEIISSGVFQFVNASKAEVYKYYEFDPSTHYIVDYSGKATDLVTNKKKKIEDPYGMSGGGLWKIQVEGQKLNPVIKYH